MEGSNPKGACELAVNMVKAAGESECATATREREERKKRYDEEGKENAGK